MTIEVESTIPDCFVAFENTRVQVANLSPPIDLKFVQQLKEYGYDVSVEHAFEWPGMPSTARKFMPILQGRVYELRPLVPITSAPLDTLLKKALLTEGAILKKHKQ